MKKILNTKRNWEKAGIGVAALPIITVIILLTVTIAGFFSIYSRAKDIYWATTPDEKKDMSLIDVDDNIYPEEYHESSYNAYGHILTSDGKTVYGPLLSEAGRPYTNLVGAIGIENDRNVAWAYRNRLYGKYNIFTGIKDSEADPIVLTLNSILQEKMTEVLLANGIDGSVICEDYQNGEIKCMVSTPAAEYLNDKREEGCQLNKNLYVTVPGSTMKIITTLLLEMQGIDVSELCFNCDGEFQLSDESYITCERAHGADVKITDALGDSCNCFFAQAVTLLDWNQVKTDLEKLGFSVNNPEAAYKTIGEITYRASETTFSGQYDFNSIYGLVGQGETLVSPVAMVQLASLIATAGNEVSPYLVYGDTEMERLELSEEEQKIFAKVKDVWEAAYREYYAVHEIYPSQLKAAKTGTAQIGGEAEKKLLMGYSDRYAFYIVINNYVNSEGVKLETVPADIARVLMEELSNLETDVH